MSPLANQSILLVEDDDAVREVLKQMLELEGYQVSEAKDGEEALILYQQHPGTFRLLLTDMAMPRLDGAELARRLRRQDPFLPVLYISGQADLSPLEEGLNQGALLIQKPISAASLFSKIQQVLQRAF